MAERLHYFTEATTPVSFDCSDSDIDSDLDDLSRRPVSETDRQKHHARQLQLWSDEARRRRSPGGGVGVVAPVMSPRRRPSSASMNDALPPSLAYPTLPPPALPDKQACPAMGTRLSADRQQSNLSERARLPNSRRVSRSHSAKNLRIRITPSSSSRSLLSDIESEAGASASAPQSPRAGPLNEPKSPLPDKSTVPAAAPVSIGAASEEDRLATALSEQAQDGLTQETQPTDLNLTPVRNLNPNKSTAQKPSTDGSRPNVTRRMSFAVRGKRLPSLKKLLRR